jgi:uncharacterized membrane protein YfhO
MGRNGSVDFTSKKINKFFLVVACCYALTLILWGILTQKMIPGFADTLLYVIPEKWVNIFSFQKGLIPLWNPYIGAGTPQLACWQPGVFYPFFWLWNLFGFWKTFVGMALFHEFLAFIGFYFWMRSQRVSEITSSLCALSFSGTAQMVQFWGFPTHLATLSWVPWIFWLVQKNMDEFSWKQFWGLVAVLSFQIWAGYPQFVFYTWIFVWFWLLFQQRPRSTILKIIAAFLMSLTLTANQWIPFLGELHFSYRLGWSNDGYSFRWIHYLTLFQPTSLGFPGILGYQGRYQNFIFNLYFGVIPLILWVMSLFLLKNKNERFFSWSSVIWLFFMISLPSIGISFMPKWLIMLERSKSSFIFIFAALTAVGFLTDQLFKKMRSSPWKKIVFLIIGLWVMDIGMIPFRVIRWVKNPYLNAKVIQTVERIKKISKGSRILSLAVHGQPLSPASETFQGSCNELVRSLQPNSNSVFQINSINAYLSFFLKGYQDFLLYIEHGYPYEGRLFDAANVKYVLFHGPLNFFKYKKVFSSDFLNVFKNAGSQPRVWEDSKAVTCKTRSNEFEKILNSSAFIERDVFLEQRKLSVVHLKQCNKKLPQGFYDNKLDFEKASPCFMEFQSHSNKPKYMVVSTAFDPGWKAWINGKSVPIFRADTYFMAVEISNSGLSKVVFLYWPNSFVIGLFVALFGICSIVFILSWNFLNSNNFRFK